MNDLTPFEKRLVRVINNAHGKRYKFDDLMEWNTVKADVEKNLKDGESMYEVFGCFVAMRDKQTGKS